MRHFVIALFFVISPWLAMAQFELDAESGISFNSANDIRFPNDANSTADRVDVPAIFGTAETGFYRLRASFTISNRHTISALYAPLEFTSTGHFKEPVRFGQYLFDTSDETTVSYRFNSYRLTYRYRLVDRENVRLDLGISAKIRDARIAFEAEGKSDETTDVGFVPLINFRLDITPGERLRFILEGDALAGPQGRAEDVFAGAAYAFYRAHSIKLGYRILEGGADVSQVYNFSLIHYASVGLLLIF